MLVRYNIKLKFGRKGKLVYEIRIIKTSYKSKNIRQTYVQNKILRFPNHSIKSQSTQLISIKTSGCPLFYCMFKNC